MDKLVLVSSIALVTLITGSIWSSAILPNDKVSTETQKQVSQDKPKEPVTKESSPAIQIQRTTTKEGIQKSESDINSFKVSRVIDGDTIELENGIKVRYIGIDTPETVSPNTVIECFGRESSDKNKELVEGKTVRLEKDVSETDKYGRLLRYVFIGDLFINDILIRQGYANAVSYPPDIKYQEQFREAETEARDNNKGLWNSCGTTTAPKTQEENTTITPSTQTNTQTACKYACSGPDKDCSDFSTHEEAQTFFHCCGFTATNDPMKLDGTNIDDGLACESLP